MSTSLASERVIINSALSLTGAAQRTKRLVRRVRNRPTRWLVAVPLGAVLLLAWWVLVVASWFVPVTLIVRAFWRGRNKRRATALRHRELLAAVETRSKD